MLTSSLTSEKQHPQSLRSTRRKKNGSTNRGYWTGVEMGSFTPLVFGTNGGMGANCKLLSQTPSQEALRKE